MRRYEMKWFLLILFTILTEVVCQLLFKKDTIKVLIGREVFLNPTNLQFLNSSDNSVCKVEVVSNEPMTQQVGLFEPQVFDCDFNYGAVKYVHHGSPLLLNDTIKFRAYKFLKEETIYEYFDLLVIVENASYNVIQPLQPLVVKEFLGLTQPISGMVLSFNYSRKEGAVCKVRMSRHILHKPAHGKIILGKEKKSIDVIKRRCDDFLQLGLRYEHSAPPSPNIDFILIIVEVTDPYLNGGDVVAEWYHIPVLIEPGFPNLPPKASFSGMYLMDVDQFIITAVTPAVLSATDSETPSDELIFNISKPLLQHQGSIVHLSDHTRSITSFRQRDLNNFDIAYKPPARSFRDRQMFEIGFVICDPDFAYSDPFTMHIAIRPAITTAPRVSMNVGIVLLEGQSRPLRITNLEVVDSDNINNVKMFVTGGLHHGRLEVHEKPAVSFMQNDIISGSVIYHHDDSDSTRDSIHLRIFDGSHSTHTKVPISIIPNDDSPPTLVINIGLKVSEGSLVQITASSLRAVDHDTSDEFVTFLISELPVAGNIWKKYAWEKIGNEIKNFTQRDINKGLIYYHHNGNEVFTDSFEIVLQDKNKVPNVSPPYTVLIRIIPVGDDPPKRDPASLFSLEVNEIDFGILGSHHLRFMDVDSQDSEILYSITTLPRFIGSFAHADPGKIILLTDDVLLKKTLNYTTVKNFTQEQINHHKIAYVPPADEIGPNPLYLQFIFSVQDKDNNVVPGQIFNITILPVNNQIPQLHTGELLVEEGSSTLLSTNELSVYDPDTLTSDLQMSVFTIPLHGSLRRSEQPLRVGDLMSLDDILTLRLEYVHDGSESLKDGFKVGVNDGLHFVSGIVRVSVEPVDDENPSWMKELLPRILINEGESLTLTYQVLAATDVDTEDSSLYFILTEAPSHGNIVLDKRKVNRFTQRDILSGEVEYVHNGQEIGPNPKEDSLTFIVTDKPFPRLIPHDSHKISVTILPMNTRPPRLYFKRAILVEEGKSVVVSEDNLSATDDDTFPSELLLVISKQPEHGYLENLRPTPGYEETPNGKKINAFPLQDVKDGFISFVQFNHSNIEPESDGFEVFVTDGIHNSTSVLVYISIILLNDEIPTFYLSNITVNEGGKYVFDNESISASDQDYPGDILLLSAQTKPKHGTLTYFVQAVNNGPLLEIPFLQLSFENFESMVYKHDGSENFIDSFTLSLNDGVHIVLKTCYINIMPINDEPPKLIKNLHAENVELNGTFILSSAVLFSKDDDSSCDELFYIIINPVKLGVLERKNSINEWDVLEPQEFSQKDVNLNLIRYRHTSKLPSSYEDNFGFILSDGIHKSPEAIFTVKLVDSGKTSFNVRYHGAHVKHGGTTVINSSVLYASDDSNQAEDILFKITKSPAYGQLVFNYNESFAVSKFTIFDLSNNLILYKHNESAKVTSDSFDLFATNGVVIKSVTFNITITGVVNKVPILEVTLPLYVNPFDPKTFTITSQHLLSYQPFTMDSRINYIIKQPTKFGSIIHDGKKLNPKNFSQEDINEGLVSYIPLQNASFSDEFEFLVTNEKDEGYLLNGEFMLKTTVFHIFVNVASSTEEPSLFISPPTDIEKVWNQQLGFNIHSYNLKATFSDSSPSDIKFYVTRHLEHGYIFHLKEQKAVQVFTQEDIDEQFIVVILKQGSSTQDYFAFHIAVDKVTFKKEYRLILQWAVVFFPVPEYSVCEDAVALNIEIQRNGNINSSSYITVTSIEQTAKESLDFVSRRINKVQFDPGITSHTWKIMIVQDDLEEAPIEQLQVILSDPENCLVNQNRTIVSIYDADRGACSQIPVEDPQKPSYVLTALTKSINGNFNSDETDDDKDDYENNSGFTVACSQNIHGLLHFRQSTGSLFQCNGKKWIPWFPNNSDNTLELETFPSSSFEFDERLEKTSDILYTSTETLLSKEIESSSSDAPHTEYCPKGWQKYDRKCHKWYKQQATWTDAQTVCDRSFGGLVVVESLDHNNWLLKLTKGKSFWIGLHASEKNEWSYKVPNDVPFQNWKKGFPRLPVIGDMKHCCVLVRASGHWINKNCDLHEHSYICSIPINSLP